MVKSALGISPGDYVLIYIAELNPNKNQFSLLDMMSLLLREKSNVCLLLVGVGEAEQELREKCDSLSISDHVIFTGYRSDVPSLLTAADIAVPSSIREGLGLNVIEAMASGVPVVAYDNRGHRSIITDGVNGFLIENGNHVAMAERVMKLMNDRIEYTRIRQEGLKRAQVFGIENVLGQMKDIYN